MAKSFRFPRWVEKTRTYSIHPVAFIDQPVATPHQPRYAQQLPPGGSQGGCAARVARLATPTELKKFLAYSNQRTTPPQSDLSVPKCRQIRQLPQRWSQGGCAARVARLATPTGSEVFSVSGCQCIPIDFTKDGKHGKITCFGSFLNIFLWETGKIKKWL